MDLNALAVLLKGLSVATLFLAVTNAQGQVAGGRVLFGVQPATGKIVPVDPATGVVGVGFAAPAKLTPTDTQIGLSGAEGGNVLIYRNSTPTNEVWNNFVWRLNPYTGKFFANYGVESFASPCDGLSYQDSFQIVNNQLARGRIFSSRPGVGVFLQIGYGGFSSYARLGDVAPIGGLAGDDVTLNFGQNRNFGYFTDGTIKQFYYAMGGPAQILSSYPSPTANIEGLAFDGFNLYASTSTGLLYTFDAYTGEVLRTVPVQGGALFGLGTAFPEPSAGCAALVAGLSLVRRPRPVKA